MRAFYKAESIRDKDEGPDYKNWVPYTMIGGFGAAAAGFVGAGAALEKAGEERNLLPLKAAAGLAFAGSAAAGAVTVWALYAHRRFSFDGTRPLSGKIIEGTAAFITLPPGGVGLDVGCGSGALAIACARNNPQGRMIGIDLWGRDFGFSKRLCDHNAEAEGVDNVYFLKGDARHIPFEDGMFDAVTSNYVYHNIPVRNPKKRQDIVIESLRVLRSGGTFAIHDIFSKIKYGDMYVFMERLRGMGCDDVRLIDTTDGRFMTRIEAASLLCSGSALLVGRKL